MKLLLPLIVFLYALSCCNCNSSQKQTAFCDTSVCIKDTIKFTSQFELRPYVYITPKNCMADTLLWSYDGMGVNRKVGLTDFLNTKVYLNKDHITCFINDTSYAWLLFNDCTNGRGYSLKLPFNKTATIGRKSSSINSIDKKFNIADNLVAYTDRGNIYVEDMKTGKQAMMTFGEKADIDYDAIHETLDSVNVTNNRIWVKVKLGKDWKTLEKNITLQ
jgi:hypothetical protein